MPKTYGGLWNRVVDWDNLYLAYLEAAKGKRYKPEVLKFRDGLEENVTNIQNHLLWGSWRPSPYREFVVYEPKRRLIMAPPFKDRVVHHALVQVVGPLFERKFIHDSYACRIGKGMHRAAARAQLFLRQAKAEWGPRTYVLKGDISRYFPSIPVATLKWIIPKTIRDNKVLRVLFLIMDHGSANGIGMPVGALTSQLWANVCMDQLDHLAKDEFGIKFYVRYMDDFLVVGPNKAWLWEHLNAIEGMLNNKLGLALNPKTDVIPASHGIDFCGYRIWDTHILPRKRNVKRARERFKALSRRYNHKNLDLDVIRPVVASFVGYMKHCSGYYTAGSALKYMVVGG